MGNKLSQDQNKEAQLLSEWPLHQQELLKQFVDSKTFQTNATVSKELVKVLELYFASTKTLLEDVKDLIRKKDSDVIYRIFENQSESLLTFSTHVVQSAVPIWFEAGSGMILSGSDSNLKQTVEFLLHYAFEKRHEEERSLSLFSTDDTLKSYTQKQTWYQKVKDSPPGITLDEFRDWIESTRLFKTLFVLVVETVLFGKQTSDHTRRIERLSSPLIEKQDKKTRRLLMNEFSNLMSVYDYFIISSFLPLDSVSWSESEKDRQKNKEDLRHTLLFSSKRDGVSWQVFANTLVQQGSCLILIKDQEGNRFGGYVDESLVKGNTNWYGNSKNYLFRLDGGYGVWEGTDNNDHYQYLCWGKKSLPNGFGMGGQFDYSGLWIDSDFIHGHSRAGPVCTTYNSPPLSSKENFIVDEVEVWLVKPIEKDDTEESDKKGVLGNSEDMEFMEMAGKKMYSKDLGPDLVEEDTEEE